jgi:hypothetical protein
MQEAREFSRENYWMKKQEVKRGMLGKLLYCWNVEKSGGIFEGISGKRVQERVLFPKSFNISVFLFVSFSDFFITIFR